jgi:hypothetical protein
MGNYEIVQLSSYGNYEIEDIVELWKYCLFRNLKNNDNIRKITISKKPDKPLNPHALPSLPQTLLELLIILELNLPLDLLIIQRVPHLLDRMPPHLLPPPADLFLIFQLLLPDVRDYLTVDYLLRVAFDRTTDLGFLLERTDFLLFRQHFRGSWRGS